MSRQHLCFHGEVRKIFEKYHFIRRLTQLQRGGRIGKRSVRSVETFGTGRSVCMYIALRTGK